MYYNNFTIGGVLVHGERASHKYIDKIKTKAGKWRYIYKNTLNYNKNKAELNGLESSRDYYRKDAKIYQNEADKSMERFRNYSSKANKYRQAQIRNEKAAKLNENHRRESYNRAGEYYEKADKAHSRGEYIDNLHKGNQAMDIANKYAPERYERENFHKQLANEYNEKANNARKAASSVYRTSKRESQVAKEVKAISDSRSRRAREVRSQINNSLQEIAKRKVNNVLNKFKKKKH